MIARDVNTKTQFLGQQEGFHKAHKPSEGQDQGGPRKHLSGRILIRENGDEGRRRPESFSLREKFNFRNRGISTGTIWMEKRKEKLIK